MIERKYVRYSEAFKLEVIRCYEETGISKNELRKKYGIRGGETINMWMRKYGKEGLINKVIRMETADEKARIKELEEENRRLKNTLSQAYVRDVTNESLLEILAEQQGLTVEELKKKVGKKL